MRKCLVLLALVAFVALCAGPVWCEAPKMDGSVVVKIHEFVTKQLNISLYGGSEKDRNAKIADLKKQYAGDLKKLADAAAKGSGDAKALQEAVNTFEANIAACAKCEHGYRQLLLDLVAFEECKKKSCTPVMAVWEKIAAMARSAKKSN